MINMIIKGIGTETEEDALGDARLKNNENLGTFEGTALFEKVNEIYKEGYPSPYVLASVVVPLNSVVFEKARSVVYAGAEHTITDRIKYDRKMIFYVQKA